MPKDKMKATRMRFSIKEDSLCQGVEAAAMERVAAEQSP
jgi:hypothetical protein